MSEIKTITLRDKRVITLLPFPDFFTDRCVDKEFAMEVFEAYKYFAEVTLYDEEVKKYVKSEYLGKLSEITEEQIVCHSIVMEFGGQWFDYMGGVIGMTIKKLTTKESLLSLLKANNIDISKEWVVILKK
jgi:hypothetical protein